MKRQMKTINIIFTTILFCIIISAGIFKQVIKREISVLEQSKLKSDTLLLKKQESLNLTIQIMFKLDSICELNPQTKKIRENDTNLLNLNQKWNH